MIGAGGAELAGKLNARTRPELVGVYSGLKAMTYARSQDGARRIDVECAALAEHIHPASVLRAGSEHLAGHELDVRRRIVGILRWHDVCSQIGRLVRPLPGKCQRAASSRTVSP